MDTLTLTIFFIVLQNIYVNCEGKLNTNTKDLSETENEEVTDDPYDGLIGLVMHAEDVRKTAMNEITTAIAKIGITLGGFASNATSQSLKGVSKVLRSARSKLKSSLKLAEDCNNRAIDLVDKVTTMSSEFVTGGLQYISRSLRKNSNYDGDNTKLVASKKKKKADKKKVSEEKPIKKINKSKSTTAGTTIPLEAPTVVTSNGKVTIVPSTTTTSDTVVEAQKKDESELNWNYFSY